MTKSRTAIVVLACLGLSACLPPPSRPGDAGGPYYEPAPQPPAPQGPAIIEPRGQWCFRDAKNKPLRNYIELVNGGIRVTPIGRNENPAFYREVGPNLYQHANGATYEFYDPNRGVWRRDSRVWPHSRCG